MFIGQNVRSCCEASLIENPKGLVRSGRYIKLADFVWRFAISANGCEPTIDGQLHLQGFQL